MSQISNAVRTSPFSVSAVVAVAGLGLAVATAGTVSAAPTYRVVAKTGDQAPGAGFASFTSLGIPAMSGEGEVAFPATLSSINNASGIWSEGQAGVGNLQLVAREGQAVPGGQQGWTFGEFEFVYFSPVMNSIGESTFGARVLGQNLDDTTDVGVFRHSGGVVERVALPLMLAPGAGISSFFTTIMNLPTISENGVVAFRSKLAGVGVNDSNDYVLYKGTPGSLSLVAREGQAVPGLAGATLTSLNSSYPSINGNEDVAFRAWIDDNGQSKWSMWRREGNALSMDVCSGNAVPWGFAWYGNSFSGFYGLSYNNAGESVFWQSYQFGQTSGDGVWMTDASDDYAIAWDGSSAPGGLNFEYIDSYSPRVDGFGTVLFEATVTGQGVNASNNSGIFRRFSNGYTQQVVREGQQAPGLPAGVLFGDFNLSSISDVNGNGEVIFVSNLTGLGINADNDRAIWVKRSNGELTMVAREGDLFEISPGVFRQIDDLSFRGGQGPESGRRAAFNNLGQVGMWFRFTDNSHAIVVAQLPPTCPGDVNGDGFVNITDLNLVLGNFGQSGNPGLPGDANLDGNVNITDLNLVLGNFGIACNPV